MGVLKRCLAFWEHDAPREASTLDVISEAEWKRIEPLLGLEVLRSDLIRRCGAAGRQHASTEELAEGVWKKVLDNLDKVAAWLEAEAGKQPPELQAQYWAGVAEGFKALVDDDGKFTVETARTNTYTNLLTAWVETEEMRRQGQTTRRDLYAWLKGRFPETPMGDEDWFCDVCDDIGLQMKPPGPPRKRA
jgi:hypothetical protein